MELVDSWSYKSCKAPVKSSPPTNQQPTFHRPDALPVAQPTVLEYWRETLVAVKSILVPAYRGVLEHWLLNEVGVCVYASVYARFINSLTFIISNTQLTISAIA